jgi:F-type H+-transporting ATPase subunit delta
MKYSARQYAQALIEALEGVAPSDEEKILDNFVEVLASNNDLRMFDDISQEFHKLELVKKGIKQVEITSAKPISRENEHQIVEELNKLVKGKIEVKKTIDEKLIGGVIIQMEDQMIDASVKNNLEQLKKGLST